MAVLMAFIVAAGPVGTSYAQITVPMPAPGTMVALSENFTPLMLKGVKVYPDHPFRLDFILDKGSLSAPTASLRSESTRLIKYFLASITVPEKDLWVNLSPYEKDRIIPDAFGVTEMGRDLLAQDYLLKQITASLIYPEETVGKEFWSKVYEAARKRYGTADVPVDTFNKVWIVPQKALVYEDKDAAYIVETRLKVMLEEDYVALAESGTSSLNMGPVTHTTAHDQGAAAINRLGSDIVREVVIPILEKEVNEGKNFAPLRQVYHALILALWYKDKMKESVLGKAYIDRDKVVGVDIDDKAAKEKIWVQYVAAFKKGVYDYIKEDVDPVTQQIVPRKFFSGGFSASVDIMDKAMAFTHDASMRPRHADALVSVNLIPRLRDHAMEKDASSGGGIDRIILQFKKLYEVAPDKRAVLLLQDALGDSNQDVNEYAVGPLVDKARIQQGLGRREAAKRTILFAIDQMNKAGAGGCQIEYKTWLDIVAMQAEIDVPAARGTFLMTEKFWEVVARFGGNRAFMAELAAQRIDLALQLGIEGALDMLSAVKKNVQAAYLGPVAAIEYKYHLTTAEATFLKAKDAVWGKGQRVRDLDLVSAIAQVAVDHHLPSADSLVREAKRFILDQGKRRNDHRYLEARIARLEFILGHEPAETDTFLQTPSNGLNATAAFNIGKSLAEMGRYEEALHYAFVVEVNVDLLRKIAETQAENGMLEEAIRTVSLINVQQGSRAEDVFGLALMGILRIALEARAKEGEPFLPGTAANSFTDLEPDKTTTLAGSTRLRHILIANEEISTDAPEYNAGCYLVTRGPRMALQLRRLGIEAVVTSELLQKNVGIDDGTDHWEKDLIAVYLTVPEEYSAAVTAYVQQKAWQLPEDAQIALVAQYSSHDDVYGDKYTDDLHRGEPSPSSPVAGGTAARVHVLNKSMMALGVRKIGKGEFNPQMGNKGAGFLVFERLGLPYPAGIVLSEDLVNTLLQVMEKEEEDVVAFIRQELINAGVDPQQSVSVRSNPKRSMPGILNTVTDTHDWLAGVRKVAAAWDTDKAKNYRRREGIDDRYDLPVIIQQWVSGIKEPGYPAKRAADTSLPFYASGAFSTRDPNTNKSGLFGNYLENASGEDLMTGGKEGIDINTLARTAPDIYRQLVEAGEKLEADVGPQEVEFVVHDGKLYFVQTRKIHFSPLAEIDYLKQQLAEGKISEARAIPQMEKLQNKLGARMMFRIREAGKTQSLGRGVASTPGAIRGQLVWNIGRARELMEQGKPLIFVANEDNQNDIIAMMFDYPRTGLITSYGNNSSHEAVLTRLAGIPSLINLNAASWKLAGDGQGIVLSNGAKFEEGAEVVLDGDTNNLFMDDGIVLEENSSSVHDASYGVKIPVKRNEFLAHYLGEDGNLKPEFTLSRLEEISKKAIEKYQRIDAFVKRLKREGSPQGLLEKAEKALFLANLEKHFAHDLLTQRQSSDKADPAMERTNGGIDLDRTRTALKVRHAGPGIRFKADQAMFASMVNASGLTPVIIDIVPNVDLGTIMQ